MRRQSGFTGTRSLGGARSELVDRLSGRVTEIEEAVLLRAEGVEPPGEELSVDYREGLRAAVSAGVRYALSAMRHGSHDAGPPPLELLNQARNAARHRVELAVVLRRYAAGYATLGELLKQEAGRRESQLDRAVLDTVQGELDALLDRLLHAVSEEYQREGKRLASTPASRRLATVRRLLAGGGVAGPELGYSLEGWHLGAISLGQAASEALQTLAGELERRVLRVEVTDDLCWVWLGGGGPIPRLRQDFAGRLPESATLAIGESCRDAMGWRQSHRQAALAFSVAQRTGSRSCRYRDVALLGSSLRDEDLRSHLDRAYLRPLAADSGDDERLRETLSAFLAAGMNASSAAAALGIRRQTVASRIRVIEERLGVSVVSYRAEIDLALRLAELRAVD